MPDPNQTIAGPVREPRNRAAHVTGSIHDDAGASRLGFTPVADMRMYLRPLKASSPRYRDAAAG